MTSQRQSKYALVTAAYNEVKFIETTIRSVIAQTIRPMKWVIVSDGSDDGTDDVVRLYAEQYPFIELISITEQHSRNFTAQVFAINRGFKRLEGCDYDFIGNLDADISLEPNYYETLLERFSGNDQLGLAGGCICEKAHGTFRRRPSNSRSSVPHAVQLFRKSCFQEVGLYVPLKYGGPDWLAEVRARQRGWIVSTFFDLSVYHHRPTAGAEGILRGRLRQGRMDYYFGTLLLFEAAKCARRLREAPILLGAFVRFYGFVSSWILRAPQPLPDEFICHLRREQRSRLAALFLGKPRNSAVSNRTSRGSCGEHV